MIDSGGGLGEVVEADATLVFPPDPLSATES